MVKDLLIVLFWFVAGYAASIYTWPWLRTTFKGAQAEIAALKARAAAIEAALKGQAPK